MLTVAVSSKGSAYDPDDCQFLQLVDSIPSLLWMANADGWVFWYNRRWYEYTGMIHGQIEGWGWQSVLFPKELPKVMEVWTAAIRSGEAFETIIPLRGADGIYRPFLTRATPLKDESGKVVRWFGTNTDITEQKQTEHALKQSEAEARAREAELAAILDAVPAITFMAHDSECRHMSSNREAYDFLGLPYGSNTSRSAPTGECPPNFRAVIDGHELPSHELPVQRAVATGKKVSGAELSLVFEDGRKRDIFGNAVPVFNAEGKVQGAVGAFIDITERKRAEQELFQVNQTLQALLRALPVGVTFSEDQTPFTIAGNPAAQRQFEVRPEDNISASALEPDAPGRKLRFFHKGRQITDAELPLQRAVAENREIPPMELEVHMPGGRRWFTEASAAPVRDQNGDVSFGVAVTVDITERKRAEETLRQAERLYRAVGESIEYGIWVCDAEGRNTYASDSFLKLVGLTQEQCSEFGWGSILHPDDAERTIAAWRECVRTEGNWEIEHRCRGVDGRWHPILARGVPVRNDEGQITHWAGINLDLSKRKEAERALMRAEKLATAGRIAATIAHEINNPLEAITNLLYLIASESDPKRIQEYTTVASMELARVSYITRQTLGFYRDSTSPQTFKITELLNEVVDFYRQELKSRKVICHTEYETDGEIYGFSGEMRQVLANLLRNAIEAAPEGGFVRISVRNTRKAGTGGVSVFISDNGPGISPEHQGRIFEPFFTTKGQKGTGLGLWVAKDLVQKHGGIIRARSSTNTARCGTCLYVFIPSKA